MPRISGAGRLIGMQSYDEVADLLEIHRRDLEASACLMTKMGEAQGDRITWEEQGDTLVVRQEGWRLMRGLEPLSMAVFDAWNGLWEGLLAVHNRHLFLEVMRRTDVGDPHIEWRVRERRVTS